MHPTPRRLAFTLLAALLLHAAACNLATEPTRIAVDPRLDELINRDAGAEDAAPPEDTSLPDVAPDVEAPEPETPFVCEPACPRNAWCLPSGLCSQLSSVCTQPDTLCDPKTVAPTTEFVCESIYQNDAGLCRRVCAPDNNTCARDQSCSRIYLGSDIYTCNDRCQDSDDCNGLDTCNVTSIVPTCRGACLPFSEDQCPAGRRCIPLSPDQGYCQTAGAAGPGELCQGEDDCGAGLICFNTGAPEGGRCVPFCAPDATSSARSCPDAGQTCLPLASLELGACFNSCNLFAAETCEEGAGCFVDDSPQGVCLPRGDSPRGATCDSTTECLGDLQCLSDGSSGSCELFCKMGVADGPGACPAGESCARLSGTSLGYCR